MCQLDWAMGCPDIWSNIILSVSVRVFPDEISIWVRLSKADCPPWHAWASFNPLRAWTEQKRGGRESLFPQLTWAVPWVFSCPLTGTYAICSPGSQVFRFGLNYIPLALLDLQLAGSRSWNFSASATTAWANSLIYISLLC